MNFNFHSRNRRAMTVSLLVLLQLASVIVILWLARLRFPCLELALRLLRFFAALYIFSRDMIPSYKLAWMMLLLFAPYSGAVIYLIGGKMGFPRFFRNKNEKKYNDLCKKIPDTADFFCDDDKFAAISTFLTRCTDMPPYKNTRCEFFPSGSSLFDELCKRLKTAEKFIFIEYFIIADGALWGKIESILKEQSKMGVEIRLLYDDAGSMNTLPQNFSRTLAAAGIKSAVFNRCRPHLNSAMNYRDHRKICVIDGDTGFCGGANIADEYINRLPRCSHWKDTGTMLLGEGVFNLTQLFLQLWNISSGEKLLPQKFPPTQSFISDGIIQPFGDSPLDDLYVSESVCAMSAMRADSYLYITTPYLIPDHETVSSLCRAAMAGVDVKIITPAVPDKWYIHLISRSNYAVLLKYGVKIYEYSPGFIHSKQLVCDDCFAMVGTANMDFRSFFLHYEAGVCLFGCRAVNEVKRDFDATLTCCREIKLSEAESLPLWQKLLQVILKPFSPLF